MSVLAVLKTKTRFLRFLQWLIVAFIFLFLGRTVLQDWTRVKEASFALKGAPFIWATLIFAFSYLIQVWAWYVITAKLGIAISVRETMTSWFYSQLGKYLPGKVWLLLGRFYLYGAKGRSKKMISLALYFEAAIGIVAAGLLFLSALILFEEMRPFYIGKGLGLILPCVLALVFLHPRVLERIFNLVLSRLERERISVSVSYLGILWILLLNLVAWIVGGLGFYLFVNSIHPVASIYFLFLLGALAFSCFLGLVALFAPSGLGVREGALVYLLSAIMPGSVAVIISILTRIWMTLIEIGLIGMIYLGDKLWERDKKGDRRG
jgi:glycosyltransferase 2 family protein